MSALRRLLRRAVDASGIANLPPPAVLAVLYAGLIVVGALMLMLPFSATEPMRFIDALFTATSAVTVTGLNVIDTQFGLTFFGQVVLAMLIQLGGLGLMTFAVLILSMLGLPIGMRQEVYLREDLKQTSMHQLRDLATTITKIVLVAEVAGALLLCLSFVPRSGFWPGLWHSVFHSISAFNNAGFSTYSTGLVPFALDPVVNVVIPALFISGGLGYGVISEINRGRGWHYYSLHVKFMLIGTAVLIVAGVVLFAILEWNNPKTLGPHDIGGKLIISWFQGVTPRTAGFNTVDIGALHDSTALLTIALMVIGGGSASTAGGLKVTTIVVLVLATLAFFRRRRQPAAFGWSIGIDQTLKVMALVAIASVLIFLGVFLLTATHDGHFLDISFEVASAFGTTGLSRNYTSQLSDFGRGVIMLIMFLGRVGPLTLGFFLATRTTPRVRYPEGVVFLG